jgi:RNA recognition motif-containing protein
LLFQELFGAIGALKRARIPKRGFAEIVFVNKDDAMLAVKKYHNRELDCK